MANVDKRTARADSSSWILGILIGVAIGVSLGIAMDNLAIGIAMGIAIGVVFAIAFGQSKKSQSTQKRPDDEHPDAG